MQGSKPQQNRTQNRRIILFLAVTFGFTWLCWLPLLINKQFTAEVPVLPGQFYLGSFGPLLGALVSVQIQRMAWFFAAGTS